MDVFEAKGIKPMLVAEMQEPFDDEQYIYELKLDGIRCLAYLDETSTDLRNKRNKQLLPHVPELGSIHRQVKSKCILDGELLILKEGKTDFFEIQRRVLLTDPFKIHLASKKFPACFVAYDIIYKDSEMVNELPLLERKKHLTEIVEETPELSISRFIANNGIELFQAAKSQGLEGVVAKRSDSRYWLGKRTKDWIKFKVMKTADCVICGYIPKENSMTSLIIGQYSGNELIYQGHVTMGVSLTKILEHHPEIMAVPPFKETPPGNEDATWLAPKLVGMVEYMPSDKPGYRQPVFKGIRDDKLPIECQII